MEARFSSSMASSYPPVSGDNFNCNQVNNSEGILIQIRKDQHPFKCGFCATHFRSVDQLDTHVQQHTKLYQCGHCQSGFNTGEELQAHYNSEHNSYVNAPRPVDFNSTQNAYSTKKPESASNPHNPGYGYREMLTNPDYMYPDVVNMVPAHREYVPGTYMTSAAPPGAMTYGGMTTIDHTMTNWVTDPHALQPSGSTSDQHQKTSKSKKASSKTGDGNVPCPSCGESFKVMEHLKKHCIMEHGHDRPFWCQHCPMRFKQIDHLTYHMKNKHSNIRSYTCPVCEKGFKARMNLWGHIRCAHLVDPATILEKPGKEAVRERLNTKRLLEFSSGDPQNNIKQVKHDALAYPATSSSFHSAMSQSSGEFQSQSQTFQQNTADQQAQAGSTQVSTLLSERLHCPSCAQGFELPEDMKKHYVNEHGDDKPFWCQQCPRQFKQFDNFIKHVETMHGADAQPCEMTSDELRAQQNKRSKITRPFPCQHCPMRFKLLAHLSRHIKGKHSSELHTCPLCNKIFKKRASLCSHVQYAHLVKPSTIIPRRKVSTSPVFDLNAQPCIVDTTRGDGLLSCPTCRENFQLADQLKQHALREHGNDRPFRCAQCSSSFKEMEHLTSHVKFKHLEKKAPKKVSQPAPPVVKRKVGRPRKVTISVPGEQTGKSGKAKKVKIPLPGSQVFKIIKDLKTKRPQRTPKAPEPERVDDRPFRCQLCSSRFKQLKQLTRHIDSLHSCEQDIGPLGENKFKIRIYLKSPGQKSDASTVSLRSSERRRGQDPLQRINHVVVAPVVSSESDIAFSTSSGGEDHSYFRPKRRKLVSLLKPLDKETKFSPDKHSKHRDGKKDKQVSPPLSSASASSDRSHKVAAEEESQNVAAEESQRVTSGEESQRVAAEEASQGIVADEAKLGGKEEMETGTNRPQDPARNEPPHPYDSGKVVNKASVVDEESSTDSSGESVSSAEMEIDDRNHDATAGHSASMERIAEKHSVAQSKETEEESDQETDVESGN